MKHIVTLLVAYTVRVMMLMIFWNCVVVLVIPSCHTMSWWQSVLMYFFFDRLVRDRWPYLELNWHL